MAPIKDTTVLVIGGSSGIGYGVAEKALAEGAKVHIASSNPSRVQSSAESLQQKHPDGQITSHIIDLSSNEVERDLEQLLTTIGSLDHIVYTAGDALAIRRLDTINLEAIQRAGHVRFAVPLLLAKLIPRFIKPGYNSSLTLTTGAGSQKPHPNWSLMAGYLTGLHGITRNLALDLKPLRVNLVSPGPVATPLWGKRGVPDGVGERLPLGKVGLVEEVAEAYVYLMKDTNATGSVISSNAGSLL